MFRILLRIITKPAAILRVMKHGQRLRKVEGWKHAQGVGAFLGSLVVLVGAATGGELTLTPEQVQLLSEAIASGVDCAVEQCIDMTQEGIENAQEIAGRVIAAVGLLLSVWITYATSDKVGPAVPGKRKPEV